MADIPIILTKAGRVNTSPEQLRADLLNLVATMSPGYTANLPGSLIEDVSSTDVGALVTVDQAVTELINSLTPYGANAFLLNQLGNIYGVNPGKITNTSVYLVFSGTVGFPVAKGFTVTDGTYQYVVQDGGIINSSGSSIQLYAVASVAGSWAVPANSVDTLVTSVPGSVSLSVTNPLPGTPSAGSETEEEYRARVLQAGIASAQGMPTLLKTLLGNVAGVQQRLVAIQQQTGGGWKVIVGGGDPYDVAYAVFQALFDISSLVGSLMTVASITNANPGVATTLLNHGLSTGNTTTINAATGMTGINGAHTVTVIDEKSFSFGVDTTALGTYTANSGYLTPNARNVVTSINDYPDTYDLTVVNPPLQTVAIALTWNTSSANLVSEAVVSELGQAALTNYVNSIPVGQPINLFELQASFQQAVADVVPTPLLTRMVFAVSINGVGVSPDAGTGVIAGDPESYFQTSAAQITVTKG